VESPNAIISCEFLPRDQVFVDLDFTLLEMNPFCFNQDGIPVPLDVHAELDDTALFKNRKKWQDIEFPQPFGRKESEEEKIVEELDAKTGASLKLTVLNPRGKIWTMIAGGGALKSLQCVHFCH
jgi:succinyl-CoA synthetase beta subunit